MANQPAFEKDNPFTRLIHRMAQRNMEAGTEVGRRGMDDPAAPTQIEPTYHTEAAPVQPPPAQTNADILRQRELEWYKQTGELRGSLLEEVKAHADDPDYEILPPTEETVPLAARAPMPAPSGKLDLTDIRSIDFASRRLHVGNVWFSLSNSDLWKFANIAVMVIKRDLSESFDKATNQFRFTEEEGSDATTREEMQRVQGVEEAEPVPSEPEGEGPEAELLQDVQEDVERPEERPVQPEVANDAEGNRQPPKKQPRVSRRRRATPSNEAD